MAGSAVAASAMPAGASAASAASATAASTASAASAASVASAASAAAQASAAKRNAEIAASLDPRGAWRLADLFAREVTRRLTVPDDAQRAYGARLQQQLASHGLSGLAKQYVVLVDRAPNVQALFIYFRGNPSESWRMLGATPVATGLPGRYEHFLTPLGVFEHSPRNMDFRAEGTTNENGIRGYGARGLRIFDFGWTNGERGWGKGGVSPMRFQMHATDPDKLEPLLGIRHSKGCVRIPGSLDAFLDRHGVLDADYEALADSGDVVRVLLPEREVLPWAGRYLVVIDSGSPTRPAWAPPPRAEVRAKMPDAADTAD